MWLARTVALRLLGGIATLFAVSFVVFLGTEALPGDAATAALGRTATPSSLAQLRHQYGLDRPVIDRYIDWLRGFAHGNMGHSLPSGESVSHLIGQPLINTVVLSAVTLVILIPVGSVLGVITAVRRDGPLDTGVGGITLGLIATPEFVVGSLLAVVFAVWLGWLPAVSLLDPSRSLLSQRSALTLPVATLVAAAIAQTIRMVRACMIDVLRSPHITAARLRGVPEWRVLFLHALPNAFAPTIQIFAITVAWLVGGVVVVEAVFQYGGLGLALTNAVSTRDVPTVQAITVLVGALYVVLNLLADLATILLDPRQRHRAT